MATEFLAHYGRYLAFAALAVVVLSVLKKMWAKAPPDAHHVAVHCLHCGWQGQVSRYKPRCSKCGRPVES